MSDEWVVSIQESDRAFEKMIEAARSGSVQQFVTAREEYKIAEDECERATIRAGYLPGWPPRTEEGLKRIGLTRDQVNEILARNN